MDASSADHCRAPLLQTATDYSYRLLLLLLATTFSPAIRGAQPLMSPVEGHVTEPKQQRQMLSWLQEDSKDCSFCTQS